MSYRIDADIPSTSQRVGWMIYFNELGVRHTTENLTLMARVRELVRRQNTALNYGLNAPRAAAFVSAFLYYMQIC